MREWLLSVNVTQMTVNRKQTLKVEDVMKKITVMAAVVLLLPLAACKDTKPSDVADMSGLTNNTLTTDNADSGLSEQVDSGSIPSTESSVPTETVPEQPSAAEEKTLPDGVELAIEGNILSRDDITEMTFDENDVWSTAKFDGFVYMTEPSADYFKRYDMGDEICGLKVTSAYNIFGNDYLDNENHNGFHCTSIADLDGILTLTGTLTVAKEDGYNLIYKKGDIMFTPDSEVFPIISGLPDNKYYSVYCGNINNALPEIAELTAGEEYKAEITVFDIELYSAMPVDACVYCAIDNMTLL